MPGPTLPPRRSACDNPEPTRDGFYLRLAQGMGFASFRGTGPRGPISASGLGSHSTLAIGGGLGRGLAIAGTVQSTAIEADFEGGPFSDANITAGDVTVRASRRARFSYGQIGALVDWYPQPLGGFHGGLSAGFGAVALTNNADDSQLAGFASSGSLFFGYDTVISRSWGFGVALVLSGVTTASLKNTDGEETAYQLKAYAIGLAASLLYF